MDITATMKNVASYANPSTANVANAARKMSIQRLSHRRIMRWIYVAEDMLNGVVDNDIADNGRLKIERMDMTLRRRSILCGFCFGCLILQ